LLGVKLPYNFDSPLKATNIIEFWSRWHVTLTRFLTAYIFSPLTLMLTRRRVARRLPTISGRNTTPGAFVMLLAFPTLTTMGLAGLWHGAGYQFLVFGGLHGAALVINHAWRLRRPHWWPMSGAAAVPVRIGCWALTFLVVVIADVFFRAASVGAAVHILQGMAGGSGVTLPMALVSRVPSWLAGSGIHVVGVFESGSDFLKTWGFIGAELFVILALPNSLEMLASHAPALGFKVRPSGHTSLLEVLTWSPSRQWAAGLSAVAALDLLSLGRLSDFIYWHF
jgi:alginate O-acetyltransferase complex protein AlgI